jgi:hypothetical protein
MLTAQAPPRSEEVYESHHTLNADVEGFPSPPRNNDILKAPDVIALPDLTGNPVEINLADYDLPNSPSRRARMDSFINYPTPDTSPFGSPSQAYDMSASLKLYEQDISEQYLVSLVSERTVDLRRQLENLNRQLEAAEKTRDLVTCDRQARARMTRVLNERRRDELCRQRREMARRIRGSVDDIDL